MSSHQSLAHLRFDRGTITVSDLSAADFPPSDGRLGRIPWVRDSRTGTRRVDAVWYWRIRESFQQVGRDCDDQVQAWEAINWTYINMPTLRDEQRTAVSRWFTGGEGFPPRQGVIVMPTGTGKTIVAVEIARRLKVACLIVAPVRDLMYQWHRNLKDRLGYDAGVIGDNTFNVKPVSVTTYDSAAIHMERLGDRFGLIVFDECHHLPGNFYRDAAVMSAAPYRLGLTATPNRADGRHADLLHLIGPTVYQMEIQEAAGRTLADYDVVRLTVRLSDHEQQRYATLSGQVREYVHERREEDSKFDWQQLCQETGEDAKAREALKAFRMKQSIEDRAEGKLRILEDLFRLHAGEPVIVFVGSNAMARDVSIRFLIPCLLSHCGTRERLEILDGFEQGVYPAVVANQILDEGVDLPEVKVAIVLGGSSSNRQATQRLGRVLRKSRFGRAKLYEIVVADTADVKRSRKRRKNNDAYDRTKKRRRLR